MADTFKNARLITTTAYTAIYTCPAATTAVVLMLQAANIDATVTYDISARWLDSSASNAVTRLGSTIGVPADTAIGLLDGKLILEAGDSLQLMAGLDNKIEVTASILEMT